LQYSVALQDKFIELLLKLLPEDKIIEFKILIEAGNKEKIQEFIRSILLDIENILSQNLKEFL